MEACTAVEHTLLNWLDAECDLAVGCWDRNLSCCYANQRFVELFGLRDTPLAQIAPQTLLGPEHRPRIAAAIGMAIAEPERQFAIAATGLRLQLRSCNIADDPQGLRIIAQTDAAATTDTRFAVLFRSTAIGLLLVNTNGRIAECNDAAADIFGYATDELVDAAVEQLLLPAQRHDHRQLRAELILQDRRKMAQGRTVVGLRRDGRSIHLNIHLTPLGRPGAAQTLVSVIDTSEQDLALERARSSAARFQRLFEHSPVGLMVVDAEGIIISVNQAAAELFGWTPDELHGQPVEVLLPARLRAAHPELRLRLSLNGERRAMGLGRDVVGQRRDGSELQLDIGLAPLDLDGSTQVLVTITDISERERARAQERLLATIARSDAAIIVSIGLDGRISSWNRGAERRLGYPAESICGRPLLPLLPRAERQCLREWLARLRAGDVLEGVELRCRHLSGQTVDLLATLTPLRDRHQRVVGVSAVALDTTNDKRNLRALERSNAALEQFAWATSHDLQEPLRMISSYLQLIDRRYREKLDDSGRQMMGFAVDGARRMQGLINGLLAFARLTPSDGNEHADLRQSLHAAMDLLATRIQLEGAQISVPAGGDSPSLVAIAQPALIQLWQNLLHNALKYRRPEPLSIVIRWQADERWILCSLRDNGRGIDPRHFDRVFRVFTRLQSDQVEAGSGIGLALCKRAVEGAGGEIWVESDGASGSCFHFRLPRIHTDHDRTSAT